MAKLILASSSPWRKDLLARLGLAFETLGANIDETPLPGEKPEVLASRLAKAKAETVQQSFPEAVVIGSDQVCSAKGKIYHKPEKAEIARQQLLELSSNVALFHTAVCVLAPQSTGEGITVDRVRYRKLSISQIDEYLAREPSALGCAGACRAEGLGISLCASISSEDPTALVGLPLITLSELLKKAGVSLL